VKFLVDANVLSEAARSAPNAQVLDWLTRNEPEVTVDPVILGELRFGILVLPKGKRRSNLEAWFDVGVRRLHCLPWDAQTGLRWVELVARLRSLGKAMPIKDSMVAATALTHGLTMVTRNRSDFQNTGLKLLDPFPP
jgi:hypothetical protein